MELVTTPATGGNGAQSVEALLASFDELDNDGDGQLDMTTELHATWLPQSAATPTSTLRLMHNRSSFIYEPTTYAPSLFNIDKIKAYQPPPPKKKPQGLAALHLKILQQLDTDGDGSVTKEEIMAADTDGDGVLTDAEIEAARAKALEARKQKKTASIAVEKESAFRQLAQWINVHSGRNAPWSPPRQEGEPPQWAIAIVTSLSSCVHISADLISRGKQCSEELLSRGQQCSEDLRSRVSK